MNRRHAVNWCAHESATGHAAWHGLCQKATRTALAVEGHAGYVGYDGAIIAWAHVPKAERHASTAPPFGAPCYFDIGKWGHAVIADDEPGWCWTTDFKREGCIDRVRIADIQRHWGARWLGWAERINGVVVYP